jgi:gamma-glutamyltranspeptidase/glutathione hydrolase
MVLRAASADLSPGHWPAAERAELQQREFFVAPPYRGTVNGGSILVTGTLSPIAVHAGIEALRQGGSAADAAATVALTQIATGLGSAVSYAGISETLYYDAKTAHVYTLDAGWGTYAQETDPRSIPPTDISTVTGSPMPETAGVGALGRQTLVGGFIAGIEALHKRFGHLRFVELFQPAIWYAENGITVSPLEAAWFQQRQPQLWRTPEGRRFASMPNGSLPKAGDLVRQPDLARTLRAVAASGAAYMYTGDWARSFVATVGAEGGHATMEDLARYKPVWRDPLSIEFNGAVVFGPGEDPSGTCPTLEALNLLSSLHIENLGPYWLDETAFKSYVQSLRFAMYSERSPQIWAFDIAHGVIGSCKARLTSEYGSAVVPRMTSLLGGTAVGAENGHHTESVIVVDRWGSVAALVHTINALTWGDTGIVVGGIPIPDAAAINQGVMMIQRPGAMIPNGMSPVIALRNGKPILAVASVGASLTPETTRLVAGMLRGREDLQTLMSAPPLLLNLSPLEASVPLIRRTEIVPTGAYDAQLLQAMAVDGIQVREESQQRVQATRGTAVMATIDQPSGAPHAVEIPTIFGFAESDLQRGVAMPANMLLAPEVLDRYVGNYLNSVNDVTHVLREGTHLFVEGSGSARTELFAESESHFFSKTSDGRWSFVIGPNGNATEMLVSRGGFPGLELAFHRATEAEVPRNESLASEGSSDRPVPPSSSAATSFSPDASGDWIGALAPAARVAFHFRKKGHGEYQGTGDSPDFASFGFPVQDAAVNGTSLSFAIVAIGARYDAEWDTATNQWVGQWKQNGTTVQLSLAHGSFEIAPTVVGINGDWHGTFTDDDSAGPDVHIETGTHGTIGRLGLLSQNLFGSPISAITRKGNHIALAMKGISATIDGELSSDSRSIVCSFTAFGATRPLTLNRNLPDPGGQSH